MNAAGGLELIDQVVSLLLRDRIHRIDRVHHEAQLRRLEKTRAQEIPAAVLLEIRHVVFEILQCFDRAVNSSPVYLKAEIVIEL